MFRAMLYTQWKWGRLAVLLLCVAAAAVPVTSIRDFEGVIAPDAVGSALNTMRQWGVLYVLLASATGLLLAMGAWGADQRGGHVYALSLPVPRWHYVLLKFGAGLVLLVPVTIALGIGAAVAANAVALPPGLQTYAMGLVVRWFFAALLAYAVFYSISAGTSRTAGLVLGVIAGLILADVMLAFLNQDAVVIETLGYHLFTRAGLAEIFTGRWMLIDV